MSMERVRVPSLDAMLRRTQRGLVLRGLLAVLLWSLTVAGAVWLLDVIVAWVAGVRATTWLGLATFDAVVWIGTAAFAVGTLLVLVRVPSRPAVASLVDEEHGFKELLRTAFDTAASRPAAHPSEISNMILRRLWLDAEQHTASITRRAALRFAVPAAAWIAPLVLAVAVALPEPARGTSGFVGARLLGSDAAAFGASTSVAVTVDALAGQVRSVALAIAGDALDWDDPGLAALAEELAELADAIEAGTIDSVSAAERIVQAVGQIDDMYVASPVRREAYRGSLVDTGLTLTAEVDGIGDHSIDDGRPEVNVTGDEDEIDDTTNVHVPEANDFRRRGVVDDAGGGPGDPAQNLGQEGFVETNVNLERTTTVGFDEYDQDLEAVRSQLAQMQEGQTTEGMRAMAGAGGDGDAGTARAKLGGTPGTGFDLERWEAFEREIVGLPEGELGRGTVQMSAPPTATGGRSTLRLSGDDYVWARAPEAGGSRDVVAPNSLNLVERYFWARLQSLTPKQAENQ